MAHVFMRYTALLLGDRRGAEHGILGLQSDSGPFALENGLISSAACEELLKKDAQTLRRVLTDLLPGEPSFLDEGEQKIVSGLKAASIVIFPHNRIRCITEFIEQALDITIFLQTDLAIQIVVQPYPLGHID